VSSARPRESLLVGAWRITGGIVIWAAHFTAIYGFTALACARERPSAVPWIIGIATLAGIALVLADIAWQWRDRHAFDAWLGIGLAGFALLAIVWEAVPALMVSSCA
jgi:hypothetical protein